MCSAAAWRRRLPLAGAPGSLERELQLMDVLIKLLNSQQDSGPGQPQAAAPPAPAVQQAAAAAAQQTAAAAAAPAAGLLAQMQQHGSSSCLSDTTTAAAALDLAADMLPAALQRQLLGAQLHPPSDRKSVV